jgi:translation initiation factor 2 subunit 1
MMKDERLPRRGEVVLGTVVRVNPFSAFISLEEYDKREGMIHISEIAGKWVRDIRKFVKVGDKVVVKVMFVDREKNQISLSLKRVRPFEVDEKMKEYKKKIKSEKMLALLAEKLKLKPEELANETRDVEDKVGNIFDAFQMSMNQQGYDLMIRKGIREDLVKAIKSVADEELEVKEASIRKVIELRSYRSDGINTIKKILIEAKKNYELDIKYVSAPKYSLAMKTKNAKMGERKIVEASEFIINKLQENGGEGKVE